MKKILGIMAIVMLVSAYAVFAGDFRILDTSLAELFEVTTAGVVSVQTSLFVPTLVVNGTLFNASGAAVVDFASDSINESDIIFVTTCPAGSSLYVNGNDLACQTNFDETFITNLTTTDCAAGNLVIGINASGGVLCAADANTANSTEEMQDAIGAMLTGNTEINITVGYDDANGLLNFTVNTSWFAAGSGLDNVVEDTTPQLGGSLDLNTFDIYNDAGGITNMTIDASGNFIITLGS